MSSISGVHHVAIGVKNLETMKSFYRNILGFTEVFAEFEESEQEVMREVVRAFRVILGGVMLRHREGGILLELIRVIEPVPRPIRKDFRYGDIGMAKITVAVSHLVDVYERLKNKVDFFSEPKVAVISGWGEYPFVYCKDPEGNLVELISMAKTGKKSSFKGLCSIGISVTDLERTISFYREHLGFDTVVIKQHDAFSGLVDDLTDCKGTKIRSCLMSADSHMEGMVELFEVSNPRGRSIPFSTIWGDFGYLQIAFSCNNIQGMVSRSESAGMEFLCSPKTKDEGEFVYAKDPDGIPIEFLFLPK
jgi:catechol 2,3-dioxygenase-like lactoylglutathione lyase family enzyme